MAVLRFTALILFGLFGSSSFAGPGLNAGAMNIKKTVDEANQPQIFKDIERQTQCMNAARAGSGSVHEFVVNCAKCHSFDNENTGNAVLDQCRQWTPDFCVSRGCKPADCNEKAPECRKQAFTTPDPGADVKTCPDGTKVMDLSRCPTAAPAAAPGPKQKTCPDGSKVAESATCPAAKKADRLPQERPNNTTGSTSTPGGRTSPSSTPPSGNSDYDKQRCSSLAQTAIRCCRNPASCMGGTNGYGSGPAPGQSLAEYCEQMRRSGASNGTTNTTAGGVCYQRYTTCASTCEDFASTYPSDASYFRGEAERCNDLAPLVAQLGTQGFNSQMASNGGDICNQMSQAQPQNMPGMPGTGGAQANSTGNPAGSMSDPTDPYGCKSNPSSAACVSCTTNPSNPTCQAIAKAAAQNTGTADFNRNAREDTNSPGNFNLADTRDGYSTPPERPKFEPQGTTQGKTIANNAGGGIPGAAGGGSGGGAKADPVPRGSPGSPGYTTDIMQGERSGGGYQGGSQMAADTDDPGGGFGGYGHGGERTPAGEKGVDLRQYLPGGKKDPNRRFAGFDLMSAQINSRHVDIWQKITNRIQEKCRLGELIGCD